MKKYVLITIISSSLFSDICLAASLFKRIVGLPGGVTRYCFSQPTPAALAELNSTQLEQENTGREIRMILAAGVAVAGDTPA